MFWCCIPSTLWLSTSNINWPTSRPPASNAAPFSCLFCGRKIYNSDQVGRVKCVDLHTWILIILGRGCFVFAPPSIAIPRMGFVLGIVTSKFPSRSCWRLDLISFDCILACSRASCEMVLWASFLSICRDCWEGSEIDIVRWLMGEMSLKLTNGRPKYQDCSFCVIDRIPSK